MLLRVSKAIMRYTFFIWIAVEIIILIIAVINGNRDWGGPIGAWVLISMYILPIFILIFLIGFIMWIISKIRDKN